ncbi:MAG: redox-regulated ATPase YchF, partial [Candidatus Levybacteria bacterium]|nr:redox-regulated ATPase YchF [Candidatus Levybacteria bacterium]
VGVPDPRLEKLAEVVARELSYTELRGTERETTLKYPPIVPATVRFVDIAGLVKGASAGAGLGNKFLSHVREVSVIAHVVRAFEDPDIVKEGSVDVSTDYETVRTELALADLSSIAKISAKGRSASGGKNQIELLEKIEKFLNDGKMFDISDLSKEDSDFVRSLSLLSLKQEIIVLNVSEEDYSGGKIKTVRDQYASIPGISAQNVVVICAKIEAELAELSEEEQKEYLFDLGLKASGLERLIQKAYEELGLISFLTAGVKEVRAWTLRAGSTALRASGEIHTDFMKKFIKAEVVSFADFVEFGGWKGAREHGKEILEGKDYVVKDGDIIEFKIGT